jgi:hypothetical protein
MDPVTWILVPSVLGGVAIAWLIFRLQGRGSNAIMDAPMQPVTTDVINISHIRAAGLGGLGLFAMALVVALFVPRIGLTVSAGALFGALLGGVMILRRRRIGPLPSSGGSAGANVVLSIDQPVASENEDAEGPPKRRRVAQAQGLASSATLP